MIVASMIVVVVVVATMIVAAMVVATMIVVVNCLLCIAYGIMRVSSKNELFFEQVGGGGGGAKIPYAASTYLPTNPKQS